MAKRDYYDVLGVSKNADAKTIKSAYRKLAKKYHPDTNSNDKNAEQHFKEITEAYNILSDEKKKKLYDQYGHAAFDGSMGDDPEEFARRASQAYGGFGANGANFGGSGFGGFGGFDGFGGNNSGYSGSDGKGGYYWHSTGPGGSSQQYYYSGNGNMGDDLNDFIKNMFHGNKNSGAGSSGSGGSSSGSFNGYGSGGYSSGGFNGYSSGGSGFSGFNGYGSGGFGSSGFADSGFGQYSADASSNPLDITSEMTVSLRDAALGAEKIISLQGSSTGSMQVKIPAGINEGQSIRLRGKGHSGPGGQTGDLLIKIHIQDDATFTREGQDIYTTAEVPYTIAILGGEIFVDTLHGPVRCHVPAGSQAGSKLRLRGKGVVSMKDKNQIGDEYVTLKITVPKHVSEREKELLRQLQDIEQPKDGRRSA